MRVNGRGTVTNVQVLDVAPELGAGIEPDQWAMARQAAIAPVLAIPRPGPWRMRGSAGHCHGDLGLLIVDGLVTRSVMLGTRGGLELLGPADVLRPWVDSQYDLAEVAWTVVAPLRMAWLDHRFAEGVAPWPQIAAAITDRLLLRARSLAYLLAASNLVTVEERLLVVLWHFAERWGRVTRDGVVLRLPVTHETMARLVGARRPTVTTALTNLANKGLVRRGAAGTWVLSGLPPATIAELHAHRDALMADAAASGSP
jgi:hypothetical protein